MGTQRPSPLWNAIVWGSAIAAAITILVAFSAIRSIPPQTAPPQTAVSQSPRALALFVIVTGVGIATLCLRRRKGSAAAIIIAAALGLGGVSLTLVPPTVAILAVRWIPAILLLACIIGVGRALLQLLRRQRGESA